VTDVAIGAALTQAIGLERQARAAWQDAETAMEKQAAQLVMRQTAAVIGTLKDWLAARAQVAAAQQAR
jgi:hypothetical protein